MVISNIYSNLIALRAVFKHVSDNFGTPDYLLCAGDFVGIGPHPNEVCDKLRGIKNLIAVKGDYDQAVVDGDFYGLDSLTAETLDWTSKIISKKNMEFLSDLDGYNALKIGSLNILLLHGSPDDYIKGEISKMVKLEKLQDYFDNTDADMIICGQGNRPFVKEFNRKFIVNPGSLGQKSENPSMASYVFVDTDNMEISFQKVNYDLDSLLRSMREKKFPKALINKFYLP